MTWQALRIGQLAARAEVTPDALRYYERLGLLPPPTRTPAGYRIYEQSALERIALIRKAQAVSLTLQEIRQVVEVAAGGQDPCQHVRALLARRVADVDRRLAELRSLRQTLTELLERNCTVTDPSACLCRIIESQPLPPPRRRRHQPQEAV